MKCANCGAENPDDKRFCGDCGSPFKPREAPGIKLQRRLDKETAFIIILIFVLLIIIGFGFLRAANYLNDKGIEIQYVAHSFYNLAWFFGWHGVAGFFMAELALWFSNPTRKKEKKGV
ncbi:MAG: zinc ribbon domain-containing protein [Thermoplasmatota archaeon]|nr:zinc ribbon domain-containing protein [Candidatus Thermoplasmatota archaeon]